MAQYNQDPIPQPGGEETTTPITIEGILDRIAEAIITSEHTNISPELVKQNQKTIRDGLISVGRDNSETLALFQKDIKANAEDLQSLGGGEMFDNSISISEIVNIIGDTGGTLETTHISISPLNNGAFSIHLSSGDLIFDVTNILSETSTSDDGTQTILNPINISQFINVEQQQTTVDTTQANEYLDTNIYELLPRTGLRQQQIDNLFSQLDDLLPPNPPTDDEYGIGEGGDGRIDRVENPTTGNYDWVGSQEYYYNNSITAPQDNTNYEGYVIDEQEAYITRLANNENTNNTGKSIESLRNRLNLYLKDVDEEPIAPEDDRPEYENKSSGYLKFRNLNQGIIIRNTNSEFIEGLNPNTQEYLETGFTITMWVRFLDKTSIGTLFNFGNPTREENPFGFKLETYVINGNDTPGEVSEFNALPSNTWKDIFQNNANLMNPNLNFDTIPNNSQPEEDFFSNSDTERFVRLVVRNGDLIYNSHVGTNFWPKYEVGSGLDLPEFNIGYNNDGNGFSYAYGLMTGTRIPINLNEWYFICATYNPFIIEEFPTVNYQLNRGVNRNPMYWMNNATPSETLVLNSGVGNKCKVEIISRTDLLRARGYKV